jgi:predicted ATP-dependent endonuclease of OLD family
MPPIHTESDWPGETPDGVTIDRPVDLGEVRKSLRVEPADILLARRFVIVEGESDKAVLTTWAMALGLDLRSAGIQLVPCGGYAPAEQVTRFLKLAYEGAEFVVVLDNGSDSARAIREIDAKHGDRVDTVLLNQSAIEAYYHPQAIAAWLRLHGAPGDNLEQSVEDTLARTASRWKALDALSKEYLGRPFEKLKDGMAIANLTPEHRIDPEIRALLLRIGRDE